MSSTPIIALAPAAMPPLVAGATYVDAGAAKIVCSMPFQSTAAPLPPAMIQQADIIRQSGFPVGTLYIVYDGKAYRFQKTAGSHTSIASCDLKREIDHLRSRLTTLVGLHGSEAEVAGTIGATLQPSVQPTPPLAPANGTEHLVLTAGKMAPIQPLSGVLTLDLPKDAHWSNYIAYRTRGHWTFHTPKPRSIDIETDGSTGHVTLGWIDGDGNPQFSTVTLGTKGHGRSTHMPSSTEATAVGIEREEALQQSPVGALSGVDEKVVDAVAKVVGVGEAPAEAASEAAAPSAEVGVGAPPAEPVGVGAPSYTPSAPPAPPVAPPPVPPVGVGEPPAAPAPPVGVGEPPQAEKPAPRRVVETFPE